MPTSRSSREKIVVTIGDPSGIGPEVALKALASSRVRGLADFLLIGDAYVIGSLERKMSLKLECPLLDLSNVKRSSFSYGRSSEECGRAAIQYLDKAIELLGAGGADALVTAPINKSSVKSAGFRDFLGHTEYLAAHTSTKDFAMMFVGKHLKITLVTRHIALKLVSESLSIEAICAAISLTHRCLRESFGIARPRIGVAGLNPHAGENGAFGDEEKTLIIPAIRKISKRGAFRGVAGPVPPDVIFHDCLDGKFDACVAMYHDQALIPFKLLYFKNGVNLTLGLPFVRTSPDHGTAFDIAGKAAADPTSMIEAIRLACRLAG